MELHNLRPAEGSVKTKKRVGRGQGSTRGGTSTRGHKGQKSRSGYSRKRNHEGGQTPIQMRVPKRGFNNPFRVAYTAINLEDLQRYAEKYRTTTLDIAFFQKQNIIKKTEKIKILGNGTLEKKLTVEAHAVSASAKEALETVGATLKLV